MDVSSLAAQLTPARFRSPPDALRIAAAGVAGADARYQTAQVVRGASVAAALAGARSVVAVSVGKASLQMHRGVVDVLGDRLRDGCIVSPTEVAADEAMGATVLRGDHPFPTTRSQAAASALVDWLAALELGSDDVVLLGVSGGASATVCAPLGGLTIADLDEITRCLLTSPHAGNGLAAVRRALSSLHGGGLRAAIGPARVVGLVLNDNVARGPTAVAAGLTFDESAATTQEARRIVAEWLIDEQLRARTLDALDRRHPPQVFGARNFVVASPADAMAAALQGAGELGYRTIALSSRVHDDVRQFARTMAGAVRDEAIYRPDAAVAIVAAGQVTVDVTGAGRGGRCQELALAVAIELHGLDLGPWSFVALGTDGRDFLEGVAGAFADETTMSAIERSGVNAEKALAANDSFRAMGAARGLVPAATTGTNVCDVYIACVGRPASTSQR